MQQNRRVFTPLINLPLAIAVLSVCGLLVLCLFYLAIPLIPVISENFNVSQIAATWIASTFGFAYAFGFLVFGPLCDRFGCKALLVPGLAMLALITVAVGASPSFKFLVLFRTFQGFIAATFAPIALVYVSEVLPKSSRAIGIGCVSTGFLLAGIPGMLLAPFASSFINRWGSKTVVVYGLVLASVGLGLEAVLGQLFILVLSSGIFVAGISIMVPSLIALVGSLAPATRGSAIALYTFILFIGASFGPIVTNLLRPIGFSGLCAILAFFLLIAAVIVAKIV